MPKDLRESTHAVAALQPSTDSDALDTQKPGPRNVGKAERGREATAMRADVVRLVRDRRYEEALSVLYAARAESPNDKDLQTSIQQIKEFLVGSYAKRLGGLDRVAGPIPVTAARSPDALLVARYVDGTSTFDDISRTCPLGRVRTLQVLVELYRSGEPVAAAIAETPSLKAVLEEQAKRVPAPSPEPPRVTPVASLVPTLTDDAPPRVVLWPASNEQKSPSGPHDADEPSRDSGIMAIEAMPAAQRFTPVPPALDDPTLAPYRDAFARGTRAFVKRQFDDAAEAFRECEKIRPGDVAAATMLRRALMSGRS